MTTSATDSPPDAFSLHATLAGCIAMVSLNDVPLVRSDLRGVQACVHSTPWIIDGENRIEITIAGCRRLADWPCGLVAEEGETAVFASAVVLAGFYADIIPDPTRDAKLVSIDWGPLERDALDFPRTVQGFFRATGRPRWAWQDAMLLEGAEPAVRERLLAVVRELHSAFERRDGAPFVDRMKTLDAEAIHFSSAEGGLAAAFAGELGRRTADPHFALEPLREEEVLFRPIADGRVVRVEDARGRPILRGVPEMEAGLALPLLLADLGGTIEIARLA